MAKVLHKKSHWTGRVHHTTVTRDTGEEPALPLLGGAEYGEFLYVGTGEGTGEGGLQEGELLLEVAGLPVSGLPRYDVLEMVRNAPEPLTVTAVRQELDY